MPRSAEVRTSLFVYFYEPQAQLQFVNTFTLFDIQDFGDGGAFPEIQVAQYPLGMGMKGKEATSNALAVQLDAQGKVKYDVIARQGHSKDKVKGFI